MSGDSSAFGKVKVPAASVWVCLVSKLRLHRGSFCSSHESWDAGYGSGQTAR